MNASLSGFFISYWGCCRMGCGRGCRIALLYGENTVTIRQHAKEVDYAKFGREAAGSGGTGHCYAVPGGAAATAVAGENRCHPAG